jgi:hypothetical protein
VEPLLQVRFPGLFEGSHRHALPWSRRKRLCG